MNEQITLKEVLELVNFTYSVVIGRGWQVASVKGDVRGTVHGNVYGSVRGSIRGDVTSDVHGDIYGDVHRSVEGKLGGTINGKQWQYVETPRQKVERLIKETGNTELLKAFNQLEDNS